jgi:polygalacturonase
LEEVDGGLMDNIIVSNITMMNTQYYPIYVTLGARNRGPKATTHMGTVKNILISNIQVTNADSLSGIQLTGSPGYLMENIRLQNIYVQYKGGGTRAQGEKAFPELDKGYPEPFLLGMNPAYGLFARHINGLQLDNIAFTTKAPDERPAIIASDVHGLEINGFKCPDPLAGKAFKFEGVGKLKIENSPVLSSDLKE